MIEQSHDGAVMEVVARVPAATKGRLAGRADVEHVD